VSGDPPGSFRCTVHVALERADARGREEGLSVRLDGVLQLEEELDAVTRTGDQVVEMLRFMGGEDSPRRVLFVEIYLYQDHCKWVFERYPNEIIRGPLYEFP
jgi:hypothetical protein